MIVIEFGPEILPDEIAKNINYITGLNVGIKPINKNIYILNKPLNDKDLTYIKKVKNYQNHAPEYFLASRKHQSEDTLIEIDGHLIGGKKPLIIAGPCSAENYNQLALTAEYLVKNNVHFMRAGIYKPRTSPYSFQGLKSEGVDLVHRIKQEFGLKLVIEIMGTDHMDEITDVADILQIGSRNMHNYNLLEGIAKKNKPILLKRGMSAQIEEFLLAAEYILKEGNKNVILCERGIKTFERTTRNTLDLNAVAFIKQVSHLPIIADPSHGTGLRSIVAPMAMASMACGANGLIIEVHPSPEKALSDGDQSLNLDEFEQLMKKLNT